MKPPTIALIAAMIALPVIAPPMAAAADEHGRHGGGGGHGPYGAQGGGFGGPRYGGALHYGPPPGLGRPPGYPMPPPAYGAPRYREGYQDYAPPAGRLRRGQRLPPTEREYVVGDYYRYHLRRPPAGYYWYRSGGDFVLASVASGLIFEVVAGDGY